MSRVWIGWAGVVAVVLVLWIGLGFFGTPTLQYSLPVIALTAGALLLPNGELWWKGLWLLGGVVIGMIGFLLGAGLLPDTPLGYTLGAVIPVTILALAAMWTKKLSYFLAGVFGLAAFQAIFTAPYLSDPQSMSVSMPQALGITLAPMALTYLVFTVLAIFVPRFAKDGAEEVGTDADTSATDADTSASAVETSASAVETEPSTASATSTTTTSASTPASAESPTVVGGSPDSATTTQMGSKE